MVLVLTGIAQHAKEHGEPGAQLVRHRRTDKARLSRHHRMDKGKGERGRNRVTVCLSACRLPACLSCLSHARG